MSFSPVDKQTETSPSANLQTNFFLGNELRISVTRDQSLLKLQGDEQTSSLTKNEIIRGRRIQEMKASNVGRLETRFRKPTEEDHGYGQIINNKEDGIAVSSEQALIDSKAFTVMNIRPDIQISTKNLGNLQPNLTAVPAVNVFNFSVGGIPEHELSQTREKSKPSWNVSSRAKNGKSTSDSSDRKTRSQELETPPVMVKYRLHSGEKFMSGHSIHSFGEIHNRQGNFYDGRSSAINKDFNSHDWNTAYERKQGTDPHKSLVISMGTGYRTLGDFLTNSDNATDTQSLMNSFHKSNQRRSAPRKMYDPQSNGKLLFQNEINQNIDSSLQTLTSIKNTEHSLSQNEQSDNSSRKVNTTVSLQGSYTMDLSNTHANNDSRLTAEIHSQSQNRGKDIRTLSEVIMKNDHLVYTEKRHAANTSEVYSGHINRDGGYRGADEVKHKQAVMKHDGFELYSYNVTASDALPMNREIPDTRPQGCAQIPAYSYSDLPKTTVVICFHNEALSVLQRTVASVLVRSPADLIEQVILVDDSSTHENVTTKLKEHFNFTGKVFFTRTSKREGLVGARLLGSRLATSEVLVFLDAHCECNVGWLEPLLFSLSHNHRKVVSPYIDTIKSENFQYKRSPAQLQGGFTWRLEFGWRAAATGSDILMETQPILTPVISGGLFAVRREYFLSMGGYDPQFNIWGGENFELSFKTWMCGGSVEIVPCSRVGHVFRASLPYAFTGDREQTVLRNLARVASVWMDEYADIFYAAVNLPDELDIGDTKDREQLRKDLNCHSFKWYLDNVFPQMDIVAPDTVLYGQVRNKGSLMCFDLMNSAYEYYLGLSACHGGRNQTLHLTSNNQLKQGDACIVPGINKQLVLSRCTSDVMWMYKRDRLNLNNTNLCVTSVDNAYIHLLPCDDDHRASVLISSNSKSDSNGPTHTKYHTNSAPAPGSSFQEWTFDYSFNWKRRRRRNA
ncbi:hypothetical protein BsWGS_00508 [Bradybaena similaris]